MDALQAAREAMTQTNKNDQNATYAGMCSQLAQAYAAIAIAEQLTRIADALEQKPAPAPVVDENELRPCPFCGGNAILVPVDGYRPSDPKTYEIVCAEEKGDCPVHSSEFDTIDEAVAWWNRRIATAAEVAALKAHIVQLEAQLAASYKRESEVEVAWAVAVSELAEENQRVAELEPCPFCGGIARVIGRDTWHTAIECASCYAEVDSVDGKSEAISKWNRRIATAAEVAALKARIAELEAQLAEQWEPVEDGEYDSQHTGSTFTIEGEWIKIIQRNILDPENPFDAEIAIDDCYRFCRRTLAADAKEE